MHFAATIWSEIKWRRSNVVAGAPAATLEGPHPSKPQWGEDWLPITFLSSDLHRHQETHNLCPPRSQFYEFSFKCYGTSCLQTRTILSIKFSFFLMTLSDPSNISLFNAISLWLKIDLHYVFVIWYSKHGIIQKIAMIIQTIIMT